MTFPTFADFFRPFLALLDRDGTLHMRDIQARLQSSGGFSAEQRAKRVPSGKFGVIQNRIGWARTYLYKSGLIERVSKGTYRLSEAGRAMLARYPSRITIADLKAIPAMRAWLSSNTAGDSDETPGTLPADEEVVTPDSMIHNERILRGLVEDELRSRFQTMTPSRFEWLVEQLVVKLGYGASDDEVRKALGAGSGDGGIDGVIKEDRLGLGHIYLQAKRWQGKVGRPAIQSFVGAMHGRAQKGVFITTSDYSEEAREYADSLQGLRIRLIDGTELASLMVDCGLGVSEERVYRTWRIDGDFFEEAE
jgi:restriction system protein